MSVKINAVLRRREFSSSRGRRIAKTRSRRTNGLRGRSCESGDPRRCRFNEVSQARQVLLTINRSDFRLLHAAGHAHAGIVICTFDIDFIGQARRIDETCAEVADMDGELVRVTRPS